MYKWHAALISFNRGSNVINIIINYELILLPLESKNYNKVAVVV